MEKQLNFKDIIDASVLNLSSGAHLSLIDVVVALAITLICALIIMWTYRYTYQGVLYQPSFGVTLVLAALVTTSIIMVISGNLILSLGMVGALSIVRFRAAIKDPLDIVFMFWAISIGIANGVAYWKVSLTSTVLLTIIMVIMRRIPSTAASFLLVVKSTTTDNADVVNIIQNHVKKFRVKNKTVKEGASEVIYEVKGIQELELMSNLEKCAGVTNTTLVAYSNNT